MTDRVARTVLEVSDVAKTFPPATGLLRAVMRTAGEEPIEALRGVSFSVGAGEVVGLVGPNGAGKSTLFRLISTLLDPTAGSIRVEGFDTVADSRAARQRIGLLLDGDGGFYHRLTGRENLEFFGVMQGLSITGAADRAAELLRRFDLAGRDVRVFGYSAGMRLRLAVARALIAEPPLLLFDEPTRSLDPEMSDHVLGMISGLADGGHAVVMASHRLNEVAQSCDRAVLLVDGQIHFDGKPDDLVTASGRLRPLVELVEGEA